MTDQTAEHLITVLLVWSYKLAALVVGYLFARLGYLLFLKGVTGEFKFQLDVKGAKADLISASPGLFLILMGTLIAITGLYKGITVQVRETRPVTAQQEDHQVSERPAKPELPRIPQQSQEESHGTK